MKFSVRAAYPALLLLSCLSASAQPVQPPQYVFAGGPFEVEDLGSVLAVNTQEKQILFRLPANNELHLLLYYVVNQVREHPLQILDVNLTRGTARLTDGVLGRPGPNATVLHPNGKVYLGSSAPGFLLEYDPLTAATRTIAPLNQTGAQFAEVGDDGQVYIGEYNASGGGGIVRFNPLKGTLENLGIMDTNQVAPQYAYTVGADTRHVFVGLGQMPWYLAVFDNRTQTKTLYWKSENDTGGAVWRGRNGAWFYQRITPRGPLWYQFKKGRPVPVRPQKPPDLYEYNCESGNTVREVARYPARFNVEVNLDDACPDSANNRALVRWRNVGQTAWQSVAMTGFRLQPAVIKRLYAAPNNQLFGFADFYGPVLRYDIPTRTTTVLGRPTFSLYDTLFSPNRIFFSGYPAATLVYDPVRAWTLSGSTPDKTSSSVNPRQIPVDFGKYHYYSAFGADGLVYVGAHHERDSTGGELGWFDPIRGTKGSLREPFLNHDVRDLKSALGGTKLVYASDHEKLFVFDVATKRIEREITPLPGIGPLDKVVEVAPGIVFGAAGNRIFKVDIGNGSILYTNTLPGLAFGGPAVLGYDRRLCLGPDGWVWMFVGNSLYRINPADAALTKLLDTPARSLVFNDGDLYLYGTMNLQRIRRALVPALPRSETESRSLPRPSN